MKNRRLVVGADCIRLMATRVASRDLRGEFAPDQGERSISITQDTRSGAHALAVTVMGVSEHAYTLARATLTFADGIDMLQLRWELDYRVFCARPTGGDGAPCCRCLCLSSPLAALAIASQSLRSRYCILHR